MRCWKVGDKPTFFNGKNLMLKENQKSQHGFVRNLTSFCDDLLLLFFWLLFLVQFQPVSKKWMTGVVSSISNNKLQTEFFFKQKTAYEIASCLVGSEMCIRDRKKLSSMPRMFGLSSKPRGVPLPQKYGKNSRIG